MKRPPLRRALFGMAMVCLGAPDSRSADDRAPCPTINFIGSATIRLNEAERGLVCGNAQTEGWKTIPLNQARYFLQVFLEQRGYHNPRFMIAGSRLSVDIGTRTVITSLVVNGLPPGLPQGKLRGIEGKLLTPKRLDAVKASLTGRLQTDGYACPDIDLAADAASGQVTAQLRPGPVYTFEHIVPAPLSGVDPGVFARYQAFTYGGRFDIRLLTLTSQRTLADALFLNAAYRVDCSTAGMSIHQHVVEGKPRSISIGVGADTEGYGVVIAQWKHSRIGASASEAEVSVRNSYLEQEAEGSLHYYLGPDTRLFVMPQALFEGLNELRYSAIVSDATISPGTSWDLLYGRLNARAGPVFNYVHMLSGLGPTSDTFLSFNTTINWETHLFEYYAADPREGWRAALETSSRFQSVQSYVSADQVKLSGQRLWNLGAFEPPALVLGTRGYAATTYTNDPGAAFEQLFPQARYFVGGDNDLRGAERQQIPTDDGGFLTAVYDGLELRLGDVLPYGLQPFVFIDGAMMGRLYFHLDPDVYWSPGWGLRWALPVGSIRTTLAHGFLWHRDQNSPPLYDPHWQFFFSFGEEF